MQLQERTRQIRTLLLIELVFVACAVFFAYHFWEQFCGETLLSCLASQKGPLLRFLLLSLLRPFALTPLPMMAVMAANFFGPILGALVTGVGAVGAAAVVYGLGLLLGRRLVQPWLASNLPQTLHFIRSQDWKVVLACRFIPFLPFDLCSLIFGLLGFRWQYVLGASFIAILPECYVFGAIAHSHFGIFGSTLTTLALMSFLGLLPGLLIEIASRKKGTSLWVRLKAMWGELVAEIHNNNRIRKRQSHTPGKIPVLLLYGYFSSRRSLTILERNLTRRGYEVLSFNLGGLLGVFFTRGIRETAEFIDYKLQRQFARHGFEQIHIVAHSKGGLVALWWLLRLGGHSHCKKLITLGTPFRGSALTWLALMTPLGFWLRDLWQMRPGSSFLKELHACPIPDTVHIYNFYSKSDKVARGEDGIMRPRQASTQIHAIAMHEISHFEFLFRQEVSAKIAEILGSPFSVACSPQSLAPSESCTTQQDFYKQAQNS